MANKGKSIVVQGTPVGVIDVSGEDYISLTDILKAKDGNFFIVNWLRNRNTLEFLGIWESIYNHDFNYVEFDIIKSQSGLNSFRPSVKEWVAKTGAIGLQSRAGRYGGLLRTRILPLNLACGLVRNLSCTSFANLIA
jgi:hypothetical protein